MEAQTVEARKKRLQQARDLVRKYANHESSVVDELIHERRKSVDEKYDQK